MNRIWLIVITVPFIFYGCCSGVDCAECDRFEFETQKVIAIDTSNYWVKKSGKLLIIEVDKRSGNRDTIYYYSQFENSKMVILGSFIRSIYETKIHKKVPNDYEYEINISDSTQKCVLSNIQFETRKAKGCCDCGGEKIIGFSLNDTSYTLNQFPVLISW